MSEHIHFAELLPAYAIGALDEDEKAEVAAHVAVCPACQAELTAYETVTDHLALAAPDADPPLNLKQRLMAQVRTPPLVVEARPVRRAPWWESLANMMRQTAPAWGLVSLILIVVLGASNLLLWQRVNHPTATPQPGVMRTINLSGTDAAPEASGTIVMSVDGEHGALVVDGLAPLDTDRQYQLWLIQDGERTSGGVFSVDEHGYAVLWLDAPQLLSDYDAFGITVEPAGGSPGPTGLKVMGSAF